MNFEERLKLLEDSRKKASNGPWKAVGTGYNMKGFPQVELNTENQHYFPVNFDVDAEFIVLSANHIQRLIDDARKMRNALIEISNHKKPPLYYKTYENMARLTLYDLDKE